MIKNVANQSIGCQMVANDGSAFTGTVTVYITKDAGTQAIGTVGSGVCTHEGNGYYTYRPSQEETNGDLIAYTFIGSTAIPQTIQVTTITAAQQSALQAATGTFAVETNVIITDALTEIGKLGLGQTPSSALSVFVLGKLNRLLDNWNAKRQAVYADEFDTLTLTIALQPHTIGPNSATFSETIRPQSIEAAEIVISNIGRHVEVRDARWWAQVGDKTRTGIPTDLYYDPAWPNGNLYLYPIPDDDYALAIRKRILLGALLLTDTFWMPPGYRDAITLTLAEDLCATPALGVPLPAGLREKATDARAQVFANNSPVPAVLQPTSPGSARGWYDIDSDRFRL